MRHPRQGVLNWFIRQLIDGDEISLYGEGKQKRDINYVDDVIEALLVAMADSRADGQVFNLGGIPLSLKEFVEKAITIYGKGSYKNMPFPSEQELIEIGDYIADYTKIKSLLGWYPKTSMELGLKKTFDYYVKFKRYYW